MQSCRKGGSIGRLVWVCQPQDAMPMPPIVHSCRNGLIPTWQRCLHRRGLLGVRTHPTRRTQARTDVLPHAGC